MDQLIDSVMQARKDKFDDPTVPKNKKPTGTLLDIMFGRRKEEEDAQKGIAEQEK